MSLDTTTPALPTYKMLETKKKKSSRFYHLALLRSFQCWKRTGFGEPFFIIISDWDYVTLFMI